jgi:type IV pilus assembly protein PilY1
MRTLTRILLASSGAALAVLSTTPARAQADLHPQLPNVLLLIDNSGSMEFQMTTGHTLPVCTPGHYDRNRWANLVTVLTGTITDTDFSCVPLDRHSAQFVTEFSEQGTAPYDKNYYLPFNRIYSNGCTYGAGTLPATWNWWDLPSAAPGSFKDTQWRNPAGVVGCAGTGFQQAGDGLLDAFKGLVRFGMMTLDTNPDPGTGSNEVSNPSIASSVYPTGAKGMWSYFHNWLLGSGTTPTVTSGPPTPHGGAGVGNPAGCPTPSFFEVGARNQAAPPWEGRLVPFGQWDSDGKVQATNDQIQMELLSSRPYGATPVAAMLDDANEFLFHDTTPVPPAKTFNFGPTDDAYWVGGCRKTFIILMSDGRDNMDLRAKTLTSAIGGVNAYNGCDSAPIPPKGGGANIAGNCPYLPADTIATNLRTNTPAQSVLTFVVGFTGSDMTKFNPVPSVPSGATTCDKLTAGDCTFAAPPAAQPSPELLACCELQKIAVAGGTSQAYFADDTVKLKVALAGILSAIIQGTTDRTTPVYAPGGNRPAQGTALQSTPSAAYQFAASFSVTSSAPPAGSNIVGDISGGMWNGLLYRERFACVSGQPVAQDPTAPAGRALGDDYALNVDYADSNNPRKFLTIIGDDAGGHGNHDTINSDNTIRPFIGATDDGFGTYKPDSGSPVSPQTAAGFISAVAAYPAAFNIPSDQLCKQAFGDSHKNATQCTTDLVNWEIGGDNVLPSDATFQTRDWRKCPTACPQGPVGCGCRQLGAIFHSTPAVVGPPREFLRDDSYTTYANTTAVAGQATMLYTATMDGQLHAFKVQAGNTVTDSFYTDHLANNELWSFFPPRVLQHLLPNFNTGGIPLLDGAPVVADVPGTVYTLPTNGPLLQRGGSTPVGWHRVLVSNGGGGGGFYYALEVTNPEDPHFLWQLSNDVDGQGQGHGAGTGTPIFGATTPTPAIAIVNVSLTSGAAPVQLPVAILAGGATGSFDTHCTSADTTSPVGATFSRISVTDPSNPHLLTGVTASPPALRCWDMKKNSNRATGNSLTIVRLDTGRVLAHFVGTNYSGAPHNGSGSDHGGDNGHGGDDNGQKASNNANVFVAPFIAPLSGIPVAYPGQTGQVSDRVYVGDADGLLWRVDMSDPDITKWAGKITLAWDSYLDDSGAQREAVGVPPIISRDPIGNPVILVATGDQDVFSGQPSSNHVWSLTENPITGVVSPNWHVRLPATGGNGARITGPMALFNSTLYFATFLPQSGNVCSDGYGSVWAVDYIRKWTGTPSIASGGTPAGMTPTNGKWPLPEFPTVTVGSNIYGQDGAPGTIVMGISVSETPTCDNTSVSPDPYFGSHSGVTGATGSNYQVSWQTGGSGGLSTTNTAVKNDNVKGMQSITPPAPGRGTRFDSWASIVE